MTEKEFTERYTRNMTDAQRQAVVTSDGATLLLAVPGSGKTTVLIARLGYMLCVCGISAENILAVTYTRAAAAELKRRFSAMFGEQKTGIPEIRTINGFSAKVIDRYGELYGRENIPCLMSKEGDRKKLIGDIYRQLTGEYADAMTVNDIGAAITYAKNMMLSDEEIALIKADGYDMLKVYKEYCRALESSGRMDYDDQMVTALQMLRNCTELRKEYTNRFRYICVDEAQDTSKIQHEIIRLLAKDSGNVFMVGDEDQSIYAFRGAYPDALADFEQTYKKANVLLMEHNFRSTPEIIRTANDFVSNNRFRREKEMTAVNDSGQPVKVVMCANRAAQFDFICEQAKKTGKQTAVLFRNNDSAVVLVDLLERSNTAYRIRSGERTFFTYRLVSDICNIVRFSKDPSDTESFMQIYYKLGLFITKEIAENACKSSKVNSISVFSALLRQDIQLSGNQEKIVRQIKAQLEQIKEMSATQALNIIRYEMGYGEYMQRNGLDASKFEILLLLARNVGNIYELLDRLGELNAIMTEHIDDENCLFTLSTIHSSKGLEYDCVYIVDVIDGVLPQTTKEQQKDNESIRAYEEERRLFYVAMTRAKKELYLFFCKDKKSEFVAEVNNGLPVRLLEQNDVFRFLYDNEIIGREYTHKIYGKGVVLARCDDDVLIKYKDGTSEIKTLSEMLRDRDRSVKYIKREETDSKAEIIKPPVNITPKCGDSLHHNRFGDGVVKSIDKHGIATVYFESLDDTKRLMLDVCLQKGIISIQ